MNAEQRLKLISKIANNTFQDDSIFSHRDELWLIGMISEGHCAHWVLAPTCTRPAPASSPSS